MESVLYEINIRFYNFNHATKFLNLKVKSLIQFFSNFFQILSRILKSKNQL